MIYDAVSVSHPLSNNGHKGNLKSAQSVAESVIVIDEPSIQLSH